MAVRRKRPEMKRTQISLEPEQFERLKRLADRRGVSFAQYLRDNVRAIEEYAEQEDREYYERMMSIVGILKDGGPDLSVKVDEIVYGPDASAAD
jgi:predicted DNA-binding protein